MNVLAKAPTKNCTAMCVNYGCGPTAMPGWLNYDASPTLRFQRIPVLGSFLRRLTKPQFDNEVFFGDVTKFLPIAEGSVQFVYCSHIIEHLALKDCRSALTETYRMLAPGGIFRGVLPDLEREIKRYLENPTSNACNLFMESTLLGLKSRPKGIGSRIWFLLGNAQHLWMWDYKGLAQELAAVGFVNIRRALRGDSAFRVFDSIEIPVRWDEALGFECMKPLEDR